MKRYIANEHINREDQLVYVGLIGVGVAAVITAVSIEAGKIDLAIRTSLFAFAVSIPLLAVSVVGTTVQQRFKYTVIPWYMDVANFLGAASGLIGVSALFWHFSWIIGVLFGLMSVVAGFFVFRFQAALEEANKPEPIAGPTTAE